MTKSWNLSAARLFRSAKYSPAALEFALQELLGARTLDAQRESGRRQGGIGAGAVAAASAAGSQQQGNGQKEKADGHHGKFWKTVNLFVE